MKTGNSLGNLDLATMLLCAEDKKEVGDED